VEAGSITIFPFELSPCNQALPRGGDPFGLALVLQSFSDGGSEAALQEGITDQDFYPQPSRSSADIQALGVIPKVCRKRATNAPGC
jgi:hypothetical protein